METDCHAKNNVSNREKRIMRISLIAVCAAALAFSGAVAADEPIELSAAQMDQITAGTLLLPNGRLQFNEYDNAAPNAPAGYLAGGEGLCDGAADAFCHPALNRRSDKAFVTAGHGFQVTNAGNDGPWSAGVASPAIGLCGEPVFGACP